MVKVLIAAACLVAGYLLGSINASIIISKKQGKDIRKMGSGNAGTTNTLRSLGARAAAVTLTVDILKGIIAVLLARLVFHEQLGEIFAGAGAILGHNFPVYYGFKGGKGILTSFAVALMLVPLAAIIALIVGVIVIAVGKYVSLGSMSGAVVLPIATAIIENGNIPMLLFMTLVAILALIRHHQNIERLIAGTERKLSVKH